MTPSVNLVILFAEDVLRSKAFYESLGLVFEEERHGTGPVHYSSQTGGVTLEIYPARDDVRSTVRLGFRVEDVRSVVEKLRASGVQIVSEPKESPWELRAVVRDSDGNTVDLTSPSPS